MRINSITSSFGRGVLMVLLGTSVALAQDQRVSSVTGMKSSGSSRFEAGLSFAQTVGSTKFSGSQTFKVNAEDATLNSSYSAKGGPGGALHVQYNFNEKFGVRLGGETSSRKTDGTFEGQIPHPFFFSRPRSFTGTQNDLDFKETAVTLTAVLRGVSGKWIYGLEAGGAFFSVDATLAERATYSETYPYDSVTFTGVSKVSKSASPIGFAAGAEFGRSFSDAVAIVVQGRYTGGTANVDVNGSKVDIKAGGASVRIGLRLILARR